MTFEKLILVKKVVICLSLLPLTVTPKRVSKKTFGNCKHPKIKSYCNFFPIFQVNIILFDFIFKIMIIIYMFYRHKGTLKTVSI